MGKFLAVVLTVLAVVAAVVQAQEDIKSMDEFKALQADGKHAFIKFYAPVSCFCFVFVLV